MIKMETNIQVSSSPTTHNMDQKLFNNNPMQMVKTSKNLHLNYPKKLETNKVQQKKKPDSSEDKSNLQAVVDMVSRPLVEPDVVRNIYRDLAPFDKMNLELGLPGLANLVHRSDVDPTVQANSDVRFDFVKWRQNPSSPLEEVLENCDIDEKGSFVRVRLDGSHVTAFDVGERWIALGYYSGAVRLFDRESLTFNKLVYDEKRDVDRYSGKISRIWISEDLVISLDTRNTLVQRTVAEPDKPTKHSLGDTLQHFVLQGKICLQVLEKQDSFDLLVCQLDGKNMTGIKQISIPKIVTSNIRRVSLDIQSKQMLVYYDEEMLDYKTWKNIEIFGGQLSHQFQEFYTVFTGQQRHSDYGTRTQFLVILDYMSGTVNSQFEINPKNSVLGPNSGLRVLTKVGEGIEANLWKLLRPICGNFINRLDGLEVLIPNQIISDSDCEDRFKLRQLPQHLLQNVLTIPSHQEKQYDEGEEEMRRAVNCKLVSENVFYDERSLIFHSQEKEQADITILDLWQRGWSLESLHKPVEWKEPPDLVESSGSSDSEETEDSDDFTEGDSDSDSDAIEPPIQNNGHVEWEPNALDDIEDLDDEAVIQDYNEEQLEGIEAGLGNIMVDHHDNSAEEESGDEMPALETGTGL